MSDSIQLHRGGFRWEVRPSLLDSGTIDQLWDEGGLRLQQWLATGAAQVLKRAPHRMLYRICLPGIDFHLKYYPMDNWRAVVRQLFRPSKARMEYDRALEVARRGVPTIEPLALGEVPGRPGASYLLTRTLPETRSLAAFLENEQPLLGRAQSSRIRQRLARELGGLIARMHDGGILHLDLHPGNILLRLDGEEPNLHLIDLLAIRLREPLDWEASRENLVVLNRWFYLRSGRTDRLRFWQSYQQTRQTALPPESHGRQERQLEAASLASSLKFWKGLDRRCRGTNRYFQRVARGGLRGHVSSQLPETLLHQIQADPEALFQVPGTRFLKETRTVRVAVVPMPTPEEPHRVLLYKRFGVRHRTDPWASLFRPTPALRSWMLGHALRGRGLPTPLPLLMLHRTRWALPQEGYLLTEFIPEDRNLLDHASHLQTLPPQERDERLRHVIHQLADVMSRLHRYRLSHRDLKAANVLVSPKPWVMPRTDKTIDGDPPASTTGADHVWLIDLVGLRQHRRMTRRRKIQNLARLHASVRAHPLITTITKLRFLKAYLGLRGLNPNVWKAYWRGIEAATQAKVNRNLRTGRPLL